MELKDYERVSKYRQLDVLSSKEKLIELKTAYFEIFKDTLTISCPNCISDGITRIQYYLKNLNQKKMNTPKTQFKLKDGLVLYLPGLATHLTNDNLTDDLAIHLLKSNSKNIAHFDSYPKELVATILGKPIPPVKTIVIEHEKPEVVAMDDAISEIMKGNTKADIIEKLGEYPHDKSWSKQRLAEQLYMKNSEELKEDEDNNNDTN